ncbi:MAG: hypothetical protein IMZ55_16740, partial [Acidobacteria bacterium]|nr:hypothetical protein [Acidobacteriota bacterium]
RVAILVPDATRQHVRIIAHNLDRAPVQARMTAWDIEPGTWAITETPTPDVRTAQATGATPVGSKPRTVTLERTGSLEWTFEPRTTTMIEMTLVSGGTPYWSRPDLGISADDIRVTGRTMRVTVHSLGAISAAPARVVLRDRTGRILASAGVPRLSAPADLRPRTALITLNLPAGADWTGGSITVEAGKGIPEITLRNNQINF